MPQLESKEAIFHTKSFKNGKKLDIKILKKKLEKIEKQLESCRTSVMQDGWQTMKYAKKARKWDILAQEKMNIISLRQLYTY